MKALTKFKGFFSKFKRNKDEDKPPQFETREVYFNRHVEPTKQETHTIGYVTNRISTSQYTFYNFIPLNLYRQFKRAANLYFLLMTTVQLIPYFAISSPVLAILPIVAVLAITAFKDALEDWRRHLNDKNINEQRAKVVKNIENTNIIKNSTLLPKATVSVWDKLLSKENPNTMPNNWLSEELDVVSPGPPSLKQEYWSNVRVGDIIQLDEGDPVPADMLIIATSNSGGVCYSDTKDLDGETNLKPRYSLKEMPSVNTIDDLYNVQFICESDAPTVNMTVFNSKVTVFHPVSSQTTVVSASNNNMLLRGMVVRNTDWAIGIVIYTGVQTKVILNSGDPPFKRSRLEIMMNQEVIFNFIVLFILCLGAAIAGGIMYSRYDRHRGDMLFVDGSINPSIFGIRLYISTLILLQNVIPISLYVTVEFIKIMHAYFIFNDAQMFYEEKQLRAVPKNWSISDDMGQVSYVFSDKTGTLTRNIMDFRMCSINGMVYGKQLPGDELDVVKSKTAEKSVRERNDDECLGMHDEDLDLQELPTSPELSSDPQVIAERRKVAVKEYLSAMKNLFVPEYVDLGDQETGNTSAYTTVDPEIFRHIKPSIVDNLDPSDYAPWTTPEKQSEAIKLFLTHLSVCHTVLVEKKQRAKSQVPDVTPEKPKKSKFFGLFSKKRSSVSSIPTQQGSFVGSDGSNQLYISRDSTILNEPYLEKSKIPRYSAESPDEASLVTAARNLGYAFLGRTEDIIHLDILGTKVDYTLLDVIEFNSTRKRMSVVVKRPAPYNDIVLFSKGADSIMINLLRGADPSESNEIAMRENSFQQIDEFANAGLRTLVFGYRIISQSEYDVWSQKYRNATACLTGDRQRLIDEACADIEHSLEYIGSTGIEDKLQEKVPDCVASLRSAGIKVWVLTGDKMETAINIGFASNLLTKDMELWTLDGKKSEDEILDQFWLVSRIIRESTDNIIESIQIESKEITPSSINSSPRVVPKKNTFRLKPKEQTLLSKISYRISRAKKYVKGVGRAKKKSDSSLQQSDLLRKSLRVLKQQEKGHGVERRFSTYAGQRFSRYLAGEQTQTRPIGNSNALVIDGKALSIILSNSAAAVELCKIAPAFKSVICCRSSPLQKSQVVELIRYGHNVITLAIGDGANDVSMIQAANIGIAIAGEEGMQAANASDYTIGRFHFLQNLLLVHGLFNYLRVCESIASFFYKNIIWAVAPFWFAFFCRFSGNMFFEVAYIQLYNLVFTVFPVIIVGCIDKPFNYKTAMLYTGTYRAGIKNSFFSHRRLFLYAFDGVYQSAVCFFVYYFFTIRNAAIQSESGKAWSIYDLSSGIVISIVTCASLTVGLNAWSWSWLMWAGIVFSIGSFFVFNIIINFIPGQHLYESFATMFHTATFWVAFTMAIILSILPRFLYKFYQKSIKPTDIDVVREIKILHKP
ncbi:hypothetical protein BB560_002693, partial [Smittium megazygosporum]